MKLSILLTVALVGVVALNAEAKKKSHLPEPLEQVGKTKIISIGSLKTYPRDIVKRFIIRSDFNDIYNEQDARVIGVINRDADVDRAPFFPKSNTLSKDVLRELADSGICDLDTAGACVVYTRKDGHGHAIVIGTRTFSSGKTFVLQGAFEREGYGSADVDNMAKDLKNKSDSKYVVFTNATSIASEVSETEWSEEGRSPKYEANSRDANRTSRRSSRSVR